MRRRAFALGALCALATASATAQPVLPAFYEKPTFVRLPDGRRLAFYCEGQGAPLVIFDSGAGGPARVWYKVQPEIAKTNRTCAYDRAGYDKSDPGPMPRHAANVVSDLYAALHQMGEKGPYVLVGHSLGGLHVRLFANLHRDEVAGMVLVDPSMDGGEVPFIEVSPAFARAFGKDGDGGPCIWATAAGRMMPGDPLYAQCGSPPAGSLMARPEMAQAVLSEAMSQVISTAQVRGSQKPYGELPLIVLTADPAAVGAAKALPRDEQRAYLRVLRAGHRAMARQSARGVERFVPGAGHGLQWTQPQTVIAAIRDVLSQVR